MIYVIVCGPSAAALRLENGMTLGKGLMAMAAAATLAVLFAVIRPTSASPDGQCDKPLSERASGWMCPDPVGKTDAQRWAA